MHKSAIKPKKWVEQRPHISWLSKTWLLLESTACVQRTKQHSSREGWGCELCTCTNKPLSPAWKENWPNWPKQKGKAGEGGEIILANRPNWNKESTSTETPVRSKTHSKPIFTSNTNSGKNSSTLGLKQSVSEKQEPKLTL